MTIESATFLHNLNASYPANADQMGEGDDHIRQMKLVLKNTFPGRAGAEGRAIVKNGAFTPASTENGCLYVTTAEVTCTLPALAGVADGTHYEFKALTNPLTLAPYSGSEYLDQGGNRVIPTGGWAIVAKVGATRWAVFTAPTLSASAITSALGATAVQNATSADLLDGFHASSFVRSVGGAGPDGSGNVATSGFSVNYATNADTLDGYHYNNLPYAAAGAYAGANSNFDWELVRNATIASNATLNVLSNYGYGIYYYTTGSAMGILITCGNGATYTMGTSGTPDTVNASDILSNSGFGGRTLRLYKLRKTA